MDAPSVSWTRSLLVSLQVSGCPVLGDLELHAAANEFLTRLLYTPNSTRERIVLFLLTCLGFDGTLSANAPSRAGTPTCMFYTQIHLRMLCYIDYLFFHFDTLFIMVISI